MSPRSYRDLQTIGLTRWFFSTADPEAVNETLKRIPGAIGFNGDFIDLVLTNDNYEDASPTETLESPPNRRDTAATRKKLRLLSQRRDLVRQFPFDVVNLDLEEFVFKAKDPFPGRVLNALRRVFAWQRRELTGPHLTTHSLAGFSLMFTTRVGPPNLPDSYLGLLRKHLKTNIRNNKRLLELLEARSELRNVALLQRRNFPLFFELGLPKVIASVLTEQDWFIDPTGGITTFEFERPSKNGSYTMLHLVMQVRRQQPPRENRAPGDGLTTEAGRAYRQVVQMLFDRPTTIVDSKSIDRGEFKQGLLLVKARRRKYYGDEQQSDLHCSCGCFG
jgi:hypothetical protein